MPLLNGFDALMSIRAVDKHARVLVLTTLLTTLLTTYKGDAQIARAPGAGAAGDMLKGALRLNLVEAIKTVHSSHTYLPAEAAMEIGAYVYSDIL